MMPLFVEVGPERTVAEIVVLLKSHDYVVVVNDLGKAEGGRRK